MSTSGQTTPQCVKMYVNACLDEICKLPGQIQNYSDLQTKLRQATTMDEAIYLWYTDNPNAYETKELYHKFCLSVCLSVCRDSCLEDWRV